MHSQSSCVADATVGPGDLVTLLLPTGEHVMGTVTATLPDMSSGGRASVLLPNRQTVTGDLAGITAIVTRRTRKWSFASLQES